MSHFFAPHSSDIYFCHHCRGNGIQGDGFLGSDGNSSFHVCGSLSLAKCHNHVGDEVMTCSNNGQIVGIGPHLRRLLGYDGSSFLSPPNAVSGAIDGLTSSIDVLNSSCTPVASTHSSFAGYCSTCARKVTAYCKTNCQKGIRSQFCGLVIHRVPVPLDLP